MLAKEITTYVIVGGFTAILYFGLMYLTISLIGFDYRVGVTLGYICAVLFHFAANRHFTFGSSAGNFLHHGAKYLVMLMVNYLVTILVVHMSVKHFGLSPYFGAVFGIVTTTALGYFLAKLWVFNPKVSNSGSRNSD